MFYMVRKAPKGYAAPGYVVTQEKSPTHLSLTHCLPSFSVSPCSLRALLVCKWELQSTLLWLDCIIVYTVLWNLTSAYDLNSNEILSIYYILPFHYIWFYGVKTLTLTKNQLMS